MILGVFSAKGGVGKTTLVANLGAALSQVLKNRVIIIETNMTASNLGLHLGILEPPVVIQDIVLGRTDIKEAILNTDYGLHVIPGSVSFVESIGSIDLRGILEEIRGKYDIILLDSSPGFNLEVYAAMKACDELLVCCQPRVPAIAGTLQTFRVADSLKVPILGVVINRITGKRYDIPISDIKRTLGWPIIATIPEDDAVEESLIRGVPVVLHAPNSRASIEIRKLAQAILTHLKTRKRVAPAKRAAKRKGKRRKR